MICVESRSRCLLCGCWLASLAFPSVRVNKNSLRQLDGCYLICGPPRCPECGTSTWGRPVPAPLARETFTASCWRPDAKSLRDIAAYRDRR